MALQSIPPRSTVHDAYCAVPGSGARVGYTYGTSGAQFDIGRLVNAVEVYPNELASVSTSFEYDRRGRVRRELMTRALVINGVDYTRTADMRTGYDAADRIVRQIYPKASGTETIAYSFDPFGMPANVGSAQAYALSPMYDEWGRLVSYQDGSGLVHTSEFGGPKMQLSALRVTDPPSPQTKYLDLAYDGYDAAGNLQQIVDSATLYSTASALNQSWQYQYDGLSRLKLASRNGDSTDYDYDGLGNMTRGNGLTFSYLGPLWPEWNGDDDPETPDAGVAPHQIYGIEPDVYPGTFIQQLYDANGALTNIWTPNLLLANDYDHEGRAVRMESPTATVRSVYDFRGERVARIINEGTAEQRITIYFGRWFEVEDDRLTRNIYFGGRLVAVSPVAAPGHLTLALADEGDAATVLAAVASGGADLAADGEYPIVLADANWAAATAGGLLVLCIGLVVVPGGRVRVGMLGHMRRGRVGAVAVVLVTVLTPVPLARPVAAGGGNPGTNPPPANPVFFVHSDHLGSTMMLTRYASPVAGCADRAVYRFYRYDAYGRTRVFDGAGVELPRGPQPTERLFTGQIWDWPVDVYYYGARFYVPEIGIFATTDPARQYLNAYAYVAWNPTVLIDPSGMLFEATTAADITLFTSLVVSAAVVAGGVYTLNPIAVNAGLGAAVGALGAAGAPGATPSSIAGGALGGGVSGTVPVAKGAGAIATVIRLGTGGALGGAVESAATQVGTENPSVRQLAIDTARSAVFNIVGGGAARQISTSNAAHTALDHTIPRAMSTAGMSQTLLN